MPLPHDIRVWLDDAWDEAEGKDHVTQGKNAVQRSQYNGMELKCMVNLEATLKGQDIIIVRIRKAAEVIE